jgi:hypothetical protein
MPPFHSKQVYVLALCARVKDSSLILVYVADNMSVLLIHNPYNKLSEIGRQLCFIAILILKCLVKRLLVSRISLHGAESFMRS